MSITILKPGLLDTIQDRGRTGYRQIGIGSSGCMDQYSAAIALGLVGQSADAAVLECHFPGPVIRFDQATRLALGGADFDAYIDHLKVPVHQPVEVAAGAILRFNRLINGARCYIALGCGLDIPLWLNSSSTHLKAGLGGWMGRALKAGDQLPFRQVHAVDTTRMLPVRANTDWGDPFADTIAVLPGPEWSLLDLPSRFIVENQLFSITPKSDRMGYRLSGTALHLTQPAEMLSSGVSFGTVQLLPDGQLIVLMADAQTTGGYPRIAQVITAHLSKLAQRSAHDSIKFTLTDIATAEDCLVKQQRRVAVIDWRLLIT